MEQDNFELFVDANSCCANDDMESSTASVEQTQTSCTPIQPTHLKDKQVQADLFTEKIKTFRTIGTQTSDVVVRRITKMHPDDINKLCHLGDHNYSLGPNNCPSTDEDVVEPCETCTPESENQSVLPECDVVQNEMIDDQEDALSDSGSLYCPSVSDDESGTDDEFSSSISPSVERKYIVFESELHKLFKNCHDCGSPVDSITKQCQGSMVTITTNCINGHIVSWQSQPLIKGTAAGNLLIPAAVLYSGNTYKHTADFAKHLNLQFVSSSHYYKIQKTILFPVVQQTWIKSQSAIVKQMKQSSSIDVCGDGRCDSPGHSAKYGTYTLMDEKTNLIMEFSIVQVTEVTSSNAMEYEGCKRTLNSIIKKKVPIRCLTTDRHTTVTAKMRTNYSSIVHQYDVWHLSKWVTKKLSKKAKKKDCEELLPWIQSVSNHLWYCAATCDKNVDILRETWLSLLHHITGKHQWKASREYKLVKKCGHPRISAKDQKEIQWLESGSPAHIALEEVITNKKLLKDLGKLTEFHHTGELESYHSVMTKYVPKREHFSYNGMVARTQLAILDHNANVGREQAEIKKGSSPGEKRFKIVCGKQRKNWVAKKIKVPKTYSHVEGMMQDVILCKQGKKFMYNPKEQAKCIAPTPKPPKKDIIDKWLSYNKK
jgi:ribonuclease HI